MIPPNRDLPAPLKAQIVETIVSQLVTDTDLVDSLMSLAQDEAAVYLNSDNQDLFCEVSGAVAAEIARLIMGGYSAKQTKKEETQDFPLPRGSFAIAS